MNTYAGVTVKAGQRREVNNFLSDISPFSLSEPFDKIVRDQIYNVVKKSKFCTRKTA